MKGNRRRYGRYCFFLLFGILFFCLSSSFSLADKKIKLPTKKGSTYQMLRYLSERYDCMFIYDSRTIENNSQAEIKQGSYSLQEAIHQVTGNKQLILDAVGRYVSIRLPAKERTVAIEEKQESRDSCFQIKGHLRDKETNEAIAYCSVSVENSSINTVTNHEGDFTISLHDSLRHSTIHFSHIGYLSLNITIADLLGQYAILALEPKIVVLPEVYIQAVNTKNILQKYFINRSENYLKKSIYMNVFYREGIEQEKGSTELTEAVFKVYKSPCDFTADNSSRFDFITTDMVKLEKMRSMVSGTEHKFLDFKIKSGVQTFFQLDVVKYAPDFLDPRYYDNYYYTHTGTSFVDEQRLYVISFQPKPGAREALYKGHLYIDAESYALVMVRFEVVPKQLKEVTKILVQKNSKSVNLSLKGVVYTVLFKEFGGIYYLNYARADLNFSSRKKMSFSNRNIHSWIEMVCTDIATTDVKPFERRERHPVRSIFSETRHSYDISFWDKYTIIAPEERFLRLIHSLEVEE